MGNTNYTEIIKWEIEKQYSSTRAFSRACNIPNATIVSALKNGIEGMSFAKVKQICDCLHLDLNSFEPSRIDFEKKESDEKMIVYYNRLSEAKKNKVIEYIKDIM